MSLSNLKENKCVCFYLQFSGEKWTFSINIKCCAVVCIILCAKCTNQAGDVDRFRTASYSKVIRAKQLIVRMNHYHGGKHFLSYCVCVNVQVFIWQTLLSKLANNSVANNSVEQSRVKSPAQGPNRTGTKYSDS